MKLRDYQIDNAMTMTKILREHGVVYLAAEVRTGKTLTSLAAANMIGANRVLFITKKKAISSIESDYKMFDFKFSLTVINYEQAHKYKPIYDFVIVDEAHSLGAYPKPAQRTKRIKKIVGDNYLVLMSGTPSPESYSQLYHQFWISNKSPFKDYANFYKWAKEYVRIVERVLNGYRVNDYSLAHKKEIFSKVEHLFITFTQKQAGFSEYVDEKIVPVKLNSYLSEIINEIVKEKYYQFPDGTEIIADTAAKSMIKIHQLSSGTVITEDGSAKILDRTKADYISKAYKGLKIAIFYKFDAEGRLLKKVFTDRICESTEEFNATGSDKIYLSQVRSGAMGTNLSAADVIIFYNIDFSSVLYWQARARMQSKDRTKDAKVHWLMTAGGIEEKIYEAVKAKKDYTTSYFRGDYGWQQNKSCKKSA